MSYGINRSEYSIEEVGFAKWILGKFGMQDEEKNYEKWYKVEEFKRRFLGFTEYVSQICGYINDIPSKIAEFFKRVVLRKQCRELSYDEQRKVIVENLEITPVYYVAPGKESLVETSVSLMQDRERELNG